MGKKPSYFIGCQAEPLSFQNGIHKKGGGLILNLSREGMNSGEDHNAFSFILSFPKGERKHIGQI